METETRRLAKINGYSNEMKEQPNPVHQPKTEMRARTNKAPQPDSVPVLVNRHHPWTESAEDTDSRLAPVSAFPDIRALDSNIRLDRTCLQRLDALLDAVSGKNGIVVVSGYRDLAEQTEIYYSSLRENGAPYTAKFVALPGCSEHHTGLAVDVGSAAGGLDFIAPEFPDDGVCGAFKARAAEFGFVQRYKAHKEHLTGISCEPWHFRYVGAPHAAIMEERDLCLEEYVEILRQERAKAGHGEASHGN
ncbi:D-alanyl-D-alanine carboxypeptidase family protein [Saccharibacillus endophyticus]|uniref:D-alanyl-D-alanine carboxypeptidase-like core domain-containing protein n=1 Tax=Saccharibacillus endophyticus TaxID=2060666 RepID=A0ABQ1ZZ72_9BACL|nr:D-alanyl-D-alanine carboxypeptidase family protein [Saccharibacillus endophyticus]GGH83020.1 hypothetical protein GCM10007362_35220 [Saccharibacillus endophyticus]